jgi:hypothetical protein
MAGKGADHWVVQGRTVLTRALAGVGVSWSLTRCRRRGEPCQGRGSESLLTPFPPSRIRPLARRFAILPPRPARVSAFL